MSKKRLLCVFFGACLVLGSCSLPSMQREEDKSGLPDISVGARPADSPPPGSYYNSDARLSLLLDAEGDFAMYAGQDSLKGTYFLRGDNIVFASGTEETLARMDEAGLVFEDVPGVFLPVGVAESFAAMGLIGNKDREYMDLGDGRWQVCDYALGLAFIYPGHMSAPTGLLGDAAVVWDGAKGYVAGRNAGIARDEGAEAFLRQYMEQTVLDDFEKLYKSSGQYEKMELLQENIPGRLASAEGIIVTAAERIYVKVILYTSTYSDGTVNWICKGFFAPEGDTAAFNAVANGVTDMTAVRKK